MPVCESVGWEEVGCGELVCMRMHARARECALGEEGVSGYRVSGWVDVDACMRWYISMCTCVLGERRGPLDI